MSTLEQIIDKYRNDARTSFGERLEQGDIVIAQIIDGEPIYFTKPKEVSEVTVGKNDLYQILSKESLEHFRTEQRRQREHFLGLADKPVPAAAITYILFADSSSNAGSDRIIHVHVMGCQLGGIPVIYGSVMALENEERATANFLLMGTRRVLGEAGYGTELLTDERYKDGLPR
jgi:hypothetical protein